MSLELTRTLPTTNYLVIDCETHGLRARFDPDVAVYFVGILTVDGEGKPSYDTVFCIEDACDHINQKASEGYMIVVHNSKFDVSVLRLRGLTAPISSILDTQVLAYLLDNTRDSYSLDALTGQKEDLMQALVEEGLLKQKNYFLTLPLKAADFWAIDWSDNLEMMDRLAVYCKQDIRATHKLYKTLQKQLPQECVEAYFLMEQPMLAVLMDLETTGALLDKPLLDTLLVDASAAVERLEAEISASVGLMPVLQYDKEDDSYVPVAKTYKKGYYNNKTHVPPYYTTPDGIMVRSWDGHIDNGESLLLYDHCALVSFNSAAATGHTYWVIARDCKEALEFAGKTKKGKPQINKDFIKEVDGLLPASFPIGKLAKANKRLQMATTLNNNLDRDNRIRCDFAHTRTLTGRLATSNPNLQNIPRPGESEDSKVFRKLFIAKPGCTLICADFAAVELRVLAFYLSIVEGDEDLANVFSSEKADAHTANATRWGVSRTVAKTLIFLLIYGGQPKLMFARKLFPTIEEAEKAFEGVHTSQPSIRRLMGKVIDDTTKKGFVKSLLGRHMHYPDLKSANKWNKLKAERQTFNALIQGSSRDILHYLLGESLPVVLAHQAHFVNVVHDEVLIEVPLEQAESLKIALDGIWNNRVDFLGSLPITGEWNSGATWFDAKG